MRTEGKTEEEVDGSEAAARSPQSRSVGGGGAELSIGMFHPVAGDTSASGVAVFNREVTAQLAELQPTYLYTGYESLSDELGDSDVDIVRLSPNSSWSRLQSIADRTPFTLRALSEQFSASFSAVMNGVLDGTLDHIERHVDVLFTHHVGETILLSNLVDVPVVRMLHGFENAGLGAKTELYLSNVAATVANSRQTAEQFSAELGRDVDEIVHPGVRVERFTPYAPAAFERDGPVVMFVGRFDRAKGISDLLEAFSTLPDDVHLSLVGGNAGAGIRRLIDTLDVGDRVTVTGEVPHEQLPQYYAAADVFCLPTKREGFGMVNLEAMACATPVVTTDLPGIRTYATDGENCLLVRPGDVDALSMQLSRLLSSPDLRERLGREGRATAEKFTWTETARQLLQVGERVMSHR